MAVMSVLLVVDLVHSVSHGGQPDRHRLILEAAAASAAALQRVDLVRDLAVLLLDLSDLLLQVGLLTGYLLPSCALLVEVGLVDLDLIIKAPIKIQNVRRLTSSTLAWAFRIGIASTSSSICFSLSSTILFLTLSCRSCSSACISLLVRASRLA